MHKKDDTFNTRKLSKIIVIKKYRKNLRFKQQQQQQQQQQFAKKRK
jgi:hypothetical protein